jgi:dTDP-4-dehydrorhamnose reductase
MHATQPIWITGARGLIGNYLVQSAPEFASGCQVIGLSRAEADLADFNAVRRMFREQAPQVVIHCAALSKSPECQKDPSLARKMNVEVTQFLAELAKDIPFFFFSTDLVFDGKKGNYAEDGAVNPLSVYAEAKAEAERIVLANPAHTVIRTSLNGGTSPAGDRGFNEEYRRAWQAGQTLRLFTDEFRSPIAASVTAQAVWELVAQKATGIFHVAGSERLSRWQIGELLAARWPQLDPKIERASLKEYQGAPRPPDCSLNCAKAQRMLSFKLPGLGEWLKANPGEEF